MGRTPLLLAAALGIAACTRAAPPAGPSPGPGATPTATPRADAGRPPGGSTWEGEISGEEAAEDCRGRFTADVLLAVGPDGRATGDGRGHEEFDCATGGDFAYDFDVSISGAATPGGFRLEVGFDPGTKRTYELQVEGTEAVGTRREGPGGAATESTVRLRCATGCAG